jgi:hypothetical protein
MAVWQSGSLAVDSVLIVSVSVGLPDWLDNKAVLKFRVLMLISTKLTGSRNTAGAGGAEEKQEVPGAEDTPKHSNRKCRKRGEWTSAVLWLSF